MPILGTIASSTQQGLSVGSYDSIQAVTLTGNQTYIDFTSIPQTYKHLQIRAVTRRTQTQTFSSFLYAQFNGDTGNNYYSVHRVNARGDGLVYPSGGAVGNFCILGFTAGSGMTANLFNPAITDILEYTSTNKTKVNRGISGTAGQPTNTDNDVVVFSSMWNSTAAITSIRCFVAPGFDFSANTVISLYGIKG